ncbi:S41 family peptidase [Maribacter litopenaei]|uniref:S41 family peptidase n=1 Tax=Maribacter litopenaei TaxID=2976127 RepID=A0ABY5YAJ6_9FLAO|nr:S41 family peptidase [Maribacter litopenaei]UWX55244.1 S41 family peptidase [Maribacter litopenaei]
MKVHFLSDLKWIYQQEEDLKSVLLDVYKNRSQGKHFYITMAANVGNPEFKNENSYYDMPYPDEGYRLLSLYRYWNMINYFFPYRHLMDENWNTKLAEYIPVFLNAKNELEYELAALQLIAEIQDTHANIYGDMEQLDAWRGINYPPVHVRFIENKLVVTDYYNEEYANKDGLKIGDVISEIQGKPIDEIVAEKTKYYPASNVPTRLRNLSEDILRSNNKYLDITLISPDREPRTQSLTLYPKDSLDIFRWYKKREGSSYKILNGNIGYVNLQNIKESDVSKIKEELKDTKGIIVDIRNYPAIFVPFSLGSYFVSQSTPFVKFTQGNTDHPGEFTFTDILEIPNDGEAYEGKLVVLVNELTQSMAEYTTMALKAGENTTVLGSTTAGSDGNVSTILLPGGLRTMISGIGVYYPNGEETQRVGIVPDVEVKPTIEGIRQGRDEVLERAIQIILEE